MSNKLPYEGRAVRTQCGTASLSVSLARGAGAFVAVTFPARFATVPKVVTSLSSGASGTASLVPRALSKTETGFNCYVYNVGTATATASVSVDWIATV